jgi:HlyD family secretion protein
VAPGSRLLQITRAEEVTLTIYVNEVDLGRIAINQLASIRIDGQPNRTFEGRIAYISPTAEFTPKNVQTKDERTKLVFAVKIDAKNVDGLLKPGLPADATIDVSRHSGQ